MAQKAIKLHIGAHKTATTYLQQYFSYNRAVLARNGVAYWPRENVRDVVKLSWEQSKRRRSSLRGRLASFIFGDQMSVRMKPWFSIERDVLLSEENLIGEGADFLGDQFYSECANRLSWLKKAIPSDRQLEVWLCIRSYPDFFASMYGEAARFWPMPTPEQYANRYEDAAGRWPSLIDQIRKALPNANLIVWAYEDFRDLEPRIIKGMTGVDQKLLRPLQQVDVRPSASNRAVREIVALPSDIQGPERMMRMLELEELYPPKDKSDRFSPWTPEQCEKLEAAWQKDRADLAARSDVTFLHTSKGKKDDG
ncbi:hypothetical protein TA5114_03432 [Cognatishimia activa]|uniref:Sulfotransferase family protein n=2 Tax=Cognatishimia activa TaxID=1715691 RepID=A0A0P1J3S9_9RHOB|nr:hypothetical protein TA5113_02571 [Cognatishimia activa]CUK27604.1 hypothetical protein TA5114_03432 [Cognatishimia activa]